jgi:hypothetical protein
MISDRAIRAALERFRLAVPAESAPRPTDLEVVLDASLSMTAGDGSKEQCARELSILLLRLSEAAELHGSVHIIRGVGRTRVIEAQDLANLAHVAFDGVQSLGDAWELQPTGRDAFTWRVVISDFLFRDDPLPLVERAATGAAKLWLVQLLDEWELHPSPGGASSLVDIETEQTVELMLDEPAIDGYRARLEALRGGLWDACKTVAASWITASAASELGDFCRQHLVPAGLLREQSP